MIDYTALDAAILDAARHGESPLYFRGVRDLADVIAKATKREEFRVIDGRVQSLRKAGKIAYDRQNGKTGWRLA